MSIAVNQTFSLKPTEQITLSITPIKEATGEPAVLWPGYIPSYQANSPLVQSITPAPDGMSAVIVPTGALGIFTVTIVGQSNQFGPPFTKQVNINVTPGPADSFQVTGVVSPKSA